MRQKLSFVQILAAAAFGLSICATSHAAPASRVFDAPAGNAVGAIRDGDRVKMLEYQTVYRNGNNERWAYIEYGDAYSKATGWIRLDNVRLQEPGDRNAVPRARPDAEATAPSGPRTYRPRSYSAPRPASQSLADTTIRDMDIDCYENSRGAIGGCNLSVEANIKPAGYSSGEAMLICQAELHWTRVGGAKQVSASRGQEAVSLHGKTLRKRLVLNFDFGATGASGATVENQQCTTQAMAYDNYSDGYGEYGSYR